MKIIAIIILSLVLFGLIELWTDLIFNFNLQLEQKVYISIGSILLMLGDIYLISYLWRE